MKPRSIKAVASQPRALFILGNHNHNTMLHQVAQQMSDFDCWFTPYYCDDWTALDVLRRAGMVEFVALGNEFRRECLTYCAKHSLQVDLGGQRGGYDIVVTCSDLIVPENVRGTRLIGIQEGMIDPPLFWYWARKHVPWLPRWSAGTACTGLSGLYDRYCVASPGYVEEFVGRGAPGHRLVVTGLPNFDNVVSYRQPRHWINDKVLACTSDGRECLRFDDRRAFIKHAVAVAAGRPLVFKFHPNENPRRAVSEVTRWAPTATWTMQGRGEELAANCATLVTEWSTLAFVGLALDIPTTSYRDLEEMRRLLPLQHARGAVNIANVCREVLSLPTPALSTFIREVA